MLQRTSLLGLFCGMDKDRWRVKELFQGILDS